MPQPSKKKRENLCDHFLGNFTWRLLAILFYANDTPPCPRHHFGIEDVAVTLFGS